MFFVFCCFSVVFLLFFWIYIYIYIYIVSIICVRVTRQLRLNRQKEESAKCSCDQLNCTADPGLINPLFIHMGVGGPPKVVEIQPQKPGTSSPNINKPVGLVLRSQHHTPPSHPPAGYAPHLRQGRRIADVLVQLEAVPGGEAHQTQQPHLSLPTSDFRLPTSDPKKTAGRRRRVRSGRPVNIWSGVEENYPPTN